MKNSDKADLIWDMLHVTDKTMMSFFGNNCGDENCWLNQETYDIWVEIIKVKNKIIDLKLKEIENESKQ